MSEQLLLTVPQAADRLAVSRSMLYQLMASGALPSVHVGRSRRIPADALAAFVQELRNDSGAPRSRLRGRA